MFEGPEKKFQRHIADYFIREHQYALLEQDEITDTEYYFAEDHLIAFLKATQKKTFERLETDLGTDASRDERRWWDRTKVEHRQLRRELKNKAVFRP